MNPEKGTQSWQLFRGGLAQAIDDFLQYKAKENAKAWEAAGKMSKATHAQQIKELKKKGIPEWRVPYPNIQPMLIGDDLKSFYNWLITEGGAVSRG